MRMQTHETLRRMNCLWAAMESLYHQAAVKLGTSDSVMQVLYIAHDQGGNCLLRDIYHQTGMTKQTLNSAVRKLEAEGIVLLKPYNGRTKLLCLTEKGRQYALQTAARVYEAEASVFDTWAKEEAEQYFRLTQKYIAGFREQVDAMPINANRS